MSLPRIVVPAVLAVLLVTGLPGIWPGAAPATAAEVTGGATAGAASAEMLQLLSRVEALQKEVRELRDLVEIQDFELRKLRQRQGDLYNDLDARLQLRERLPGGGAPGGGVQSPAAETVPALPGVPIEIDTEVTAAPTVITPQPPAASAPEVPAAADAPAAPAQAVTETTVSALAPAAVEVSALTLPASPAPAPEEGTAAPVVPATPVTAVAQQAYDDAFALLKQSRYSDAIAAFTIFLEQYPNTELSDNAQYWIAESHYITRSFDEALRGFQAVRQYALSERIPGARLKIGYVQEKTGAYDEARATFGRIIEDFPSGSRIAISARNGLQRIEQQN